MEALRLPDVWRICMAKKSTRDEKKLNYSQEIRKLKEEGPKRLYLLYGPEDYLREQFLIALKKRCIPEGEDSFSFKRMDGPELDCRELEGAIDAVPFMTERSFVELRGVDINKLKDADTCVKLLSDIPDYCTIAFVQSAQYEPDGRLKLIKAIRERGCDMKFTQQSQGQLVDWISRRFAAAGKSVDFEAVQRLIFISGDLMNKLIPEIEKVAAYAKGDRVTVNDVEAVAHHIPEAVIFSLSDQIAHRSYEKAAATLAELLSDKNNEPIALLALLGAQMRKLYAARLALEEGLGLKYVMDTCSIKYEFLAKNLVNSARGFTLPQLKSAVELCADADYMMKSSSQDDEELLKEIVMRIAAGEDDV